MGTLGKGRRSFLCFLANGPWEDYLKSGGLDMPRAKRSVDFLNKIQSQWKSMAVIGGILITGIVGWNYAMAQVEKTAEKTTQATINKAMIDGAKDSAAQAVKEQLPAISKQVANEVVQQLKQEQMIRPPPEKKP